MFGEKGPRQEGPGEDGSPPGAPGAKLRCRVSAKVEALSEGVYKMFIFRRRRYARGIEPVPQKTLTCAFRGLLYFTVKAGYEKSGCRNQRNVSIEISYCIIFTTKLMDEKIQKNVHFSSPPRFFYVFTLYISRITQKKILNRFSQNSVER